MADTAVRGERGGRCDGSGRVRGGGCMLWERKTLFRYEGDLTKNLAVYSCRGTDGFDRVYDPAVGCAICTETVYWCRSICGIVLFDTNCAEKCISHENNRKARTKNSVER